MTCLCPRPLVAGALLAACHHARPSADARRCFQTGEFANYGCAEVHGRVIDALGRPVAGVAVVARPPVTDSLGGVHGLGARTDSAGWYTARVLRSLGPPYTADTAVVWVRAAWAPPPPSGPPGAAPPAAAVRLRADTGSAMVTIRFRPVGARPQRAEVRPIVLAGAAGAPGPP